MLTSYIEAAMRHATYEWLPESSEYFGRILGLQGVWASAPTREACEAELREVLEGWIVLGLQMGDPIPDIDGIGLAFAKVG